MQTITEETKKKVVKLHIQDGHTISSLAAEYGICHATISKSPQLPNVWYNQVRPHSYNDYQTLYEARYGLNQF